MADIVACITDQKDHNTFHNGWSHLISTVNSALGPAMQALLIFHVMFWFWEFPMCGQSFSLLYPFKKKTKNREKWFTDNQYEQKQKSPPQKNKEHIIKIGQSGKAEKGFSKAFKMAPFQIKCFASKEIYIKKTTLLKVFWKCLLLLLPLEV